MLAFPRLLVRLTLAVTPFAFAAPTATVQNGVLSGVATDVPGGVQPVNKFLGVPYAQKALRFEPAKAAAPRTEPIDCSTYGDTCIQLFAGSDAQSSFIQKIFNTPAPKESEDCLYLNVFAPAASNATGGMGGADASNATVPAYNTTSTEPSHSSVGKAVLFWIYGGGFQFGSSTLPTYDGSQLAANEDVIVVTHNYRMNVFGFPGSPELADDEHNLGLLDQRLALQWVRDNIAAFGGDPEKITIFGESAGGFSVDSMVLSMPEPPFRAAIMESGQATYFPSAPNELAAIGWRSLMTAVECEDLACVKQVDVNTLLAAMKENSAAFQPVTDDVTVVSNPAERRSNGSFAQVPVLTGSNANELRLLFGSKNQSSSGNAPELGSSVGGPFAGGDGALAGGPPGVPEMPSLEDLLKGGALVREAFEDIHAINEAYPLGSALYPNLQYQVAAILTDVAFTCPQAKQANDSAEANIPTWRYYYNATTPNTAFSPEAGAYHAQEIPQVFGTYPAKGATDQQIALSKAMSKAWADFAKNPSQGPGWKGVQTGSVGILGDAGNEKGTGVTVAETTALDQSCALLERIQQTLAEQGAHMLAQMVAAQSG